MKSTKSLLVISICYLLHIASYAQTIIYKSAIAGFYNCENLYDTLNDPDSNDEEFLPDGPRHYTGSIYRDKIARLAKVIAAIGTEVNPDGPALLGVAEIENRTVLNDLAQHPLLQSRHYRMVHYNSKDARGVDVALLYNPKYFIPDSSRKLQVQLPPSPLSTAVNTPHYTRDILWIKGKLDNEIIHIYVNHWPSRLGGATHSFPARAAAAATCKKHLDSILLAEPGAKALIMGDLNDDPVNRSVTGILQATGKRKAVTPANLFNPWMELYKKGAGTLAYQDAWCLFDQVILSHAFLERKQAGFFFYKARIFRKREMIEQEGRYKGYPKRTWDGFTYHGGYSDHFPVYTILLKKSMQR
jgi:hypothetical protein